MLSSASGFASDIKISGFGNAVYGKSDASAHYFGINESGSFLAQSSFGVQGDIQIDDNVSVTSQFIYREGADGDTEVVVDYAFVNYQIDSGLDTRVGKLRIPLYLESENIYVGKATPWIIAPSSVYSHNDATSHLGADITWNRAIRSVDYSAQFFVGKTENDTNLNFIQPGLLGEVETTNLKGLSLMATGNDFVAHLSVAESKVAFNFNDMDILLAGTTGYDLAANETLLQTPERLMMLTVGGRQELTNDILVQAEFMQTHSENPFVSDRRGYYVTSIYDMDDYEVALTYAATDYKDANGKFANTQIEYKGTLTYNYSTSMKFAAEYSFIESDSNINPNFDQALSSNDTQVITAGLFVTF